VRFGRKSRNEESADAIDEEESEDTAEALSAAEPSADPAADRASGPYDASDIEDLDQRECIDLGSLLVTPAGPMEMRLQVDEESGQVMAAVLVDDDGALELRAFAAARGSGAWDELRPRISSETARMGGTATEEDGTFGTEVVCVVPIQTPEGQQATQVTRISGHEGPNWLLRATLMGQPASEPVPGSVWEETIRSVVVRRGREAMVPGAPLQLALPPDARPVEGSVEGSVE
jgi:hypothetical protein